MISLEVYHTVFWVIVIISFIAGYVVGRTR